MFFFKIIKNPRVSADSLPMATKLILKVGSHILFFSRIKSNFVFYSVFVFLWYQNIDKPKTLWFEQFPNDFERFYYEDRIESIKGFSVILFQNIILSTKSLFCFTHSVVLGINYACTGFKAFWNSVQVLNRPFQNVSAISHFRDGAMSLCRSTFWAGILNTAIRCCMSFTAFSYCACVNPQFARGQMISIPSEYLFRSRTFHQDDTQACHKTSVGSPIL